MQHEITEPSDLLDPFGELVQKGWARKLILNYNREYIFAGWSRIKEWDYYAVLHPDYGITFTISDLGYAALLAVVWLDFKKKTFISDDRLVWFTRGNLNLPRTSNEGDIEFSKKGMTVSFKKNPDTRVLNFDFPEFNEGMGIKAELTLSQDPKMDTMVIASSWKKKPTRFYYNQKINCMPAKGTVQVGGNSYEFKETDCFGVLDWGRGVWTYKNTWYWGSASGKLDDGTLVGWNIGYGFSDRSQASENLIFYDGKAHKIEDVTFHFDRNDFLKPWKFTSSDGRFEMDFEPIVDRNSMFNFVIIKSEQHQVFGYFTGDIILDDGKKVHVDKLLGFAEEVYNKW